MENPIWGDKFLKKKRRKEDIFTILKNIPIFEQLSSKELQEVEKIVHQRKYKKGEAVIHKGNPGLGMYIVIKGGVEIIDEEKKPGQRTLATLGEGSFFGEVALLDESPRSASAIATEESDIVGFFRPDFLDLIKRKPKMGTKILFSLAKIIGERLRRTNELLAEVQKEKETSSHG
ncbi:MAG: cyclic nucleotide-binding domain-containing protein [Candidatus Aminicenantales bacterium]